MLEWEGVAIDGRELERRKVTSLPDGGRESKEGSDSRRAWEGGGSQGSALRLPGC